MFNLVQLQEKLKDLPMQALMGYANGANPQIPPFLALGELNRRKKMQESAAAEQAQAMEGAPTIKDQIEQSAGLLALQGNRQRQAAQQQQGIQAAMPMAAPNTTTSEPAQMAGGGFIDDVVVPRDYQAGGIAQGMDPQKLKQLMLMKAMQQRQRPGISSIPVGNMFKRGDYAGGGIVAFNGETGSEVEAPAAVNPQEIYQEIYRRAKQRKSLAEQLKEAGLLTPPETSREEISALEAQKARQAEGDTVARRVMALDPLRLGRSMSDYLSKQEAAQTDVESKLARAKDLKEKARYDAARGNIKDAIADEMAADKELKDIASGMSKSSYEGALGQQAIAGKTTDWMRRYESYLPSVMNKLGVTDPKDPRVMAATARLVDESIGLAREKVGVQETQAATAASRESTQDYEKASATVDGQIARGGLKYKEYRDTVKNKGQAAADALREDLIREELRRMRGRTAPPPAASTPAAAPANLPPGAKLVGTSGGKPVYQLPNGQKVIQQ